MAVQYFWIQKVSPNLKTLLAMRIVSLQMIAATGHPVQRRGEFHKNSAIFVRAWSVLMLVYIETASQVNIKTPDGIKHSCWRHCFSSKELAM
jgi:hypothetical protein